MTEVQKIKQALDPELYVKAVARWQKEDEAAKLTANKVVRFPGAWLEVLEAPQTPKPPQETPPQEQQKQEPDVGLRCTLAMVGVWVLTILALI